MCTFQCIKINKIDDDVTKVRHIFNTTLIRQKTKTTILILAFSNRLYS